MHHLHRPWSLFFLPRRRHHHPLAMYSMVASCQASRLDLHSYRAVQLAAVKPRGSEMACATTNVTCPSAPATVEIALLRRRLHPRRRQACAAALRSRRDAGAARRRRRAAGRPRRAIRIARGCRCCRRLQVLQAKEEYQGLPSI